MNIYEAITSIMSEGYAIAKNKRNTQQGFQYRGIDDVMNTFQPLLAKYRVFLVPEVLEQQRHERVTKDGKTLLYSILRMKYTFCAEDGSSVSAVVVGEGMDSGDKASNKAMAVAMKYAMFQVFCIPTEEMPDPDADTPPETMPQSTSTAESQQQRKEANDLYFRCENCGEVLKPYAGADGKQVGIRKHAEGSKAKFGKIYCINCISKMNGGNENA